MHQKALLTATLFGLPMFAVNMNGTRDDSPAGWLDRRRPDDEARRARPLT